MLVSIFGCSIIHEFSYDRGKLERGVVRHHSLGKSPSSPEIALNTTTSCCSPNESPDRARRALLSSPVGLLGMASVGGLSWLGSDAAYAQALTREERDKLTADAVIEAMKAGNERFRSGKPQAHNYLAQKQATAAGQYPAAVILSCIDSRAPAEIILDARIGDAFNARVAGNISNDDLLGSMEFACAAAGAKVILVMGHSACGAVKGAIDDVKLGHLSGLLDKIKPAVAATSYSGERTSKNAAFVDEVARTNVLRTLDGIRHQSGVLAGLEKDGRIKIVGSMYYLVGGRVEFLT
ncbi:MAG: carbonic anhydrase [Gammaproteobacteria bacterium]|nr:carbonic anhydrase [Gammaproteobacteria bacterium]